VERILLTPDKFCIQALQTTALPTQTDTALTNAAFANANLANAALAANLTPAAHTSSL